MGYYLLDHPNPHGPHYYPTRRAPLRLIVIHITAGLERLAALSDQAAERTARYAAITDRDVSWHSGSDTDSVVRLLPATCTAWHCHGYNSRSYGHEISKRDVTWAGKPAGGIDATLRRAAEALRPITAAYGIPLVRLTRAQVDSGAARFAAHADLDPGRRRDPGKDFPWQRLFDPAPTPPSKEGDVLQKGDKGNEVADLRRWLRDLGQKSADDGDFGPVTEAVVKALQTSWGYTPSGRADLPFVARVLDLRAKSAK